METLTANMIQDLRPARPRGATEFDSSTPFSAYDAVVQKNRRKAIVRILRAEDDHLRPYDRKTLIAANRDIQRNFSLAGWAIRKHLDYVATFTFQSRMDDPALDAAVEGFMAWWSRPENCDIAAKHELQRLVRLWEERATVDGDIFVVKLSDGRLQSIEGDRIGTPNVDVPADFVAQSWFHGVQVTPGGRALRYCVCRRDRTTSGFIMTRIVPAWNVEHHGFFQRVDQVRGISPLAAVVNTFRDVYEGFDYALAKLKVSQMFGLAFYRDYDGSGIGQTTPSNEGDAGYDVDMGRGPMVLDLNPGDKAEFLESKSPSTEFQQFTTTMIATALKGLDIPYSFYDEAHTNYSGARQALLQYEQSAASKRRGLQGVLGRLTRWRLGLAVADGQLKLPRGVTVDDLKFEFVPAGLPWIDPLKETNADVLAVNNALESRTDVLRARGKEFTKVVDDLAREEAYLKAKGVTLVPGFAPVPAEAGSGGNRGQNQ